MKDAAECGDSAAPGIDAYGSSATESLHSVAILRRWTSRSDLLNPKGLSFPT